MVYTVTVDSKAGELSKLEKSFDTLKEAKDYCRKIAGRNDIKFERDDGGIFVNLSALTLNIWEDE